MFCPTQAVDSKEPLGGRTEANFRMETLWAQLVRGTDCRCEYGYRGHLLHGTITRQALDDHSGSQALYTRSVGCLRGVGREGSP